MWVSGFTVTAGLSCDRLKRGFSGKITVHLGEGLSGFTGHRRSELDQVPSRAFIFVPTGSRVINGANTMNSEPNERMSYVVSNMASSQQNTGQEISLAGGKGQMASKLWLNHSQVEHQIYEVMLAEVMAAKTRVCAFSLRQLMILTRLPNYSAIRRGLNGLIQKHSIERYKVVGDTNSRQQVTVYFVFTPEEILERNEFVAEHSELGKDVESSKAVIGHAMSRIAERNDLSRREAEVAICCAEGLTNQEIGKRLYISEQTVKFHLRHIFVKYGVKRRTELISQLLSQMNSSSDDMESRK